MKFIVIDPRNAGLANKADVWLRVRPGTDGALALGLANIMIERGWYDEAFVRDVEQRPPSGALRYRQVAQDARTSFPAAARDNLSPGIPNPAALSVMIRRPAATRHPPTILPCEANTLSQP